MLIPIKNFLNINYNIFISFSFFQYFLTILIKILIFKNFIFFLIFKKSKKWKDNKFKILTLFSISV